MDRNQILPLARRALTLVVAAVALTACDDGNPEDITGTQEPGADATTLSVYLKDAPGDVDSVWVQVEDVILVGDGGQTSLLEAPTDLINITALRDSALALTQDLEVDAGMYGQVRFIIESAVLETTSGEVYVLGGAEHPGGLAATGELKCPSCAQSGLKVKLSGGMELTEGSNGLLLDFDVSQSFGHQAGNSGKWIMHPVIHGATADPGDIESGEAQGLIQGTVSLGEDAQGLPVVLPACGNSAPTLEAFVPVAVATTLTDDEGMPLVFSGETTADGEGFVFEIDVPELDVFDLAFLPAADFGAEALVWTATVEPATVTLDAAQDEVDGVAYAITGATCEAANP